MDLGHIQFNPNHKIEASARDASEGIRFLLIGFIGGALGVVASFLLLAGVLPDGIAMAAMVFFWLVSLAGVYGAYLTANALGWPGVALAAIVVGAFIPYVKFVLFIILVVMGIDLIRRAGFAISFFSPLRRKTLA